MKNILFVSLFASILFASDLASDSTQYRYLHYYFRHQSDSSLLYIPTGTPISEWPEVTVEDGRITAIDWADSGLYCKSDGNITNALNKMDALQSIKIENNYFDIYETYQFIQSSVPRISFSPQKSNNEPTTQWLTKFCDSVTLVYEPIEIDTGSHYEWFKNGESFAFGSESLTVRDSATYTLEITNDLIPDLTIEAATYMVRMQDTAAITRDSLAIVALYDYGYGSDGAYFFSKSDRDMTPFHFWPHLDFNSQGRVTGIWLIDSDYRGTLPPQIGDLSELLTIQIRSDPQGRAKVTGIPEEIGKLKKLRNLWLGNSAITEIPAEIGECESLRSIELWEAPLTTVPLELGNLDSLEELQLWGGYITKEELVFPEGFTGLPSLKELSISRRKITKMPSFIYELENLTRLNISNNPIDSISDEIKNLITLDTFFHTSLNLDFTSLEHIAAMGLPTHSQNKRIPSEFYFIDKDSSVTLDATIGGTQNNYEWFRNDTLLPETSATLTTGIIGEYQCKITSDSVIDRTIIYEPFVVAYTNSIVTDSLAIVEILNKCEHNGDPYERSKPLSEWEGVELSSDSSRVAHINWLFREIVGEIPATLQYLNELETFSVDYSEITSFAPMSDTALPQLRTLSLNANGFDSIPSFVRNLQRVESISFAYNNLTTIEEIALPISQLKTLDLSNNELTSIPSSVLDIARYGGTLTLSSNRLPLQAVTDTQTTPYDGELKFSPQKYLDSSAVIHDSTSGDVLTVQITDDSYRYQWLRNSFVTPDTGVVFRPTRTGSYACKILLPNNNPHWEEQYLRTFSYPCNNIPTPILANRKHIIGQNISVAPNPAQADESFTVQVNHNSLKSIEWKLFDVVGNCINEGVTSQSPFTVPPASATGEQLPSGNYLLIVTIADADGTIHRAKRVVGVRQ